MTPPSLRDEQQQQRNKDIVSKLFETLNAHDLESAEELLSNSSNYSFHIIGMPPMDVSGRKQIFAGAVSAFPDFHHNIIDVVAENDKVAVRYIVTGTHKGQFQGIPPTGKQVSFEGTEFITINDGKIAEERVFVDVMGWMQQLGVIIPTTNTATSPSSQLPTSSSSSFKTNTSTTPSS
jgi:steroid delta-isomerase-like uncharacterized protein